MSTTQNTQIVQNAYAAFGRRDIPALLELMTDTIDWQMFGPKELPTTGPRRGKPEVKRFFDQVETLWNFVTFESRHFIADGDRVICLGAYSGTGKSTGRPFASEFAHAFTISGGKVSMFREYTDTANLVSALAPATARV